MRRPVAARPIFETETGTHCLRQCKLAPLDSPGPQVIAENAECQLLAELMLNAKPRAGLVILHNARAEKQVVARILGEQRSPAPGPPHGETDCASQLS